MRQVHPDDLPRVMEEEERSRDSGQTFVSEYRMLARDGRVVWVRDEAEVVQDESGHPSYLRGVMLDITERKRAEEERREAEERFQRITASAHDAIIEIDERERIAFWNDAAERMFGYPAGEAVGRPLRTLIVPPEYREAMEEGFERFRGTGLGPFVGRVTEITARRRDGSTFPVELSVSALGHDDAWGAVAVVRDISERKRAEEELRESLEMLRRTDAERRKLMDRLVNAQEDEREILASEIHEGPIDMLTTVGLRLHTLRRRCTEPHQLEIIAQLEEALVACTARLRHLAFELRPPALESEGLAAALRRYLDEVAPEAGFDFHVQNELADEPPSTTRTILYRIAQEALANVSRHARATRVEVLLQAKDGGFLVRVRDDGCGFSPQDLPEPASRRVGLSDMRERAETAGGWFRVDSAPGRGTTVESWLPGDGGEPPSRTARSIPTVPELRRGRTDLSRAERG